jgi:dienelactone hydrolase
MVRPQGPGPHPALLFVSGCSGFAPEVAPEHFPREAQTFAAQGFAVVFVDYLGARGRRPIGHDPRSAAAAREEVRRFLAR